jgi:hypothetical protein
LQKFSTRDKSLKVLTRSWSKSRWQWTGKLEKQRQREIQIQKKKRRARKHRTKTVRGFTGGVQKQQSKTQSQHQNSDTRSDQTIWKPRRSSKLEP